MSKTEMQTKLVSVFIAVLSVKIAFTFTILLLQGFNFHGFNISSDVQLRLVNLVIGDSTGLLCLVCYYYFRRKNDKRHEKKPRLVKLLYSVCHDYFSRKNDKRHEKKPRREFDRLYIAWRELINLKVDASVKHRKRLKQSKINFPEVERRDTYRRKTDFEIYTYSLASP